MPVLTPIPGGFMHGKIVRIQGALSPAAQRYFTLFQCLKITSHCLGLVLHFSVIF